MKAEIRRQFIHFFFGSLFIALVAVQGTEETLLLLAAFFIIGLLISYLIKKGFRLPLISEIVERVESRCEEFQTAVFEYVESLQF